MIRINAFIRLKDAADAEQVKQIAQELVAQSRKDEGNIAYDLFHSALHCYNSIDGKEADVHTESGQKKYSYRP